MIRGQREIGLSNPTKRQMVFKRNPVNIMMEILSPIAYSSDSTRLMLYNLRALRTKMPGINVRYMKPTNCRKKAIGKPRISSPITPQKAI